MTIITFHIVVTTLDGLLFSALKKSIDFRVV